MRMKRGQNLSDSYVSDRDSTNGHQKEERTKWHCFAQERSVKVALKKFDKKGKYGLQKEVKWSNDRTTWKPAQPNNLTKDEKRKSTKSMMLL